MPAKTKSDQFEEGLARVATLLRALPNVQIQAAVAPMLVERLMTEMSQPTGHYIREAEE